MKLKREEFVHPPFERTLGYNGPLPFDDIFQELETFVELIGPEKIISINELENPGYTRWIVWYWSNVN